MALLLAFVTPGQSNTKGSNGGSPVITMSGDDGTGGESGGIPPVPPPPPPKP